MFLISTLVAAVSVLLVVWIAQAQHHRSLATCSAPCVPGDESIMNPKEHGTSHTPVQSHLKWNCSNEIADRICNYNRHYAEYSGYFLSEGITFIDDVNKHKEQGGGLPITFYDSNTGKSLFVAPSKARSWDDFIEESTHHGWPSFRDDEVDWQNVRVLPNGETVSVDGTHLVRVKGQQSRV